MDWDSYFKKVYDSWTTPLKLGILDEWCKHTVSDVDFLETVLHGNKQLRILDVSCGWGRHTLELTRRGYKVVGLDYSFPLLKLAKTAFIHANTHVPLLVSDRRGIWWEEVFDVVIQLYDAPWSEFWVTYEKHVNYMFRIYRALKPGGYFIAGTPDYHLDLMETIKKEKKHLDSTNAKILDEMVANNKFNHYSREKIHDLAETSLFAIEKELNGYDLDSGYDPSLEGLVLVGRALKTTVELWVFSRNPQLEVLLLRRTMISGWGKVFWQPITGTLDLDETPDHAAIRELGEETGITIWKQFVDLKEPFFFPTKGLGTLHKTVYAVEVEKQPIEMDPKEHDAYKWVPPENVLHLLYWDSNVKAFEIFKRFLHNNEDILR